MSAAFRSLFIMIELASAKPNKEWSVKTVLIPIVAPWYIDSRAKAENAWNKHENNKYLFSSEEDAGSMVTNSINYCILIVLTYWMTMYDSYLFPY